MLASFVSFCFATYRDAGDDEDGEAEYDTRYLDVEAKHARNAWVCSLEKQALPPFVVT
jgi:hypothetical protein